MVHPALPVLGSLVALSDSLPSLPLRNRSSTTSTHTKKHHLTTTDPTTIIPDTLGLAPQITSSPPPQNPTTHTANHTTPTTTTQARNLAYLTRTLAQTKIFRSQLAHDTSHQALNRYPPLALLYGKDTPTCCGAAGTSNSNLFYPSP